MLKFCDVVKLLDSFKIEFCLIDLNIYRSCGNQSFDEFRDIVVVSCRKEKFLDLFFNMFFIEIFYLSSVFRSFKEIISLVNHDEFYIIKFNFLKF